MQISNEVCKKILNSMSFFAKGHTCCATGFLLSCLVLQEFSLPVLYLWALIWEAGSSTSGYILFFQRQAFIFVPSFKETRFIFVRVVDGKSTKGEGWWPRSPFKLLICSAQSLFNKSFIAFNARVNFDCIWCRELKP